MLNPQQQKTPLTPLRQFAGPRYWPSWLGLGVLWLIAHLPYGLQLRLGAAIGALAYRVGKRRRDICRENIALCFPELSAAEQETLIRDTFRANGIGVIEAAIAWSRDPESLRGRVHIEGSDHLKNAMALGKGVLLIGGHYSTLELGGTLLSLFHPMNVTYRAHKNPLIEAVMTNSRAKHFARVIEREDVRQAMRSLKDGDALWFAPDQDYGARHSVFVPFFGVEAATITATSRFARMNDSPALMFSHVRNADGSGYTLTLGPVLEGFPSGDDEADARRINAELESLIRQHPEQYLWLHRRFKTQRDRPSAAVYNRN
jgi:KDO2-lipid IV(A) lauroyltransferase